MGTIESDSKDHTMATVGALDDGLTLIIIVVAGTSLIFVFAVVACIFGIKAIFKRKGQSEKTQRQPNISTDKKHAGPFDHLDVVTRDPFWFLKKSQRSSSFSNCSFDTNCMITLPSSSPMGPPTRHSLPAR